MSGKVLVQIQTPVTQKPEAVEALAAYLNKPIEAGVLDLGAAKLIKSNNGDAFYTVTAKACIAPPRPITPASPASIRESIFHKSRCLPRRKRASGRNASGREA